MKKTKILITGANGQVGSELRELAPRYENFECYFYDAKALDITREESVMNILGSVDADVIVNCAAYTAVDKAEEEEEKAAAVNGHGVGNLAKAAKIYGCKLIHISTDYVFDGTHYKPYKEDDPVCPASAYGRGKLAGEKALLSQNLPNSAILRTSWVYSAYGNNFVKTMLKLSQKMDALKVIFDQVGTPTHAADLAEAIFAIIPGLENAKTEIYNYSNEGVTSWYDFALEIFEQSGIAMEVAPIESFEYPTPAKRPHYSVLNKSKIKKDFAIIIPHWKEGLQRCLRKMKEMSDD